MKGYDNQGRKRCGRCREYKWLKEFHNARHTNDGKSGYCVSCAREKLEEWRRKKGSIKGGQGRSNKPRDKRVPEARTEEEKRTRLMEYGYIPKGSITRRCITCKRLRVREVVNENGICAVCSRKFTKIPNKRGRPRKYKERTKAGRLRAYKQTETYRAQHKASKHRRRAREKAGGSFTGKEWLALKLMYNNICLCCGKQEPEITLTADHIIPLSLGGNNTIENIQPLCFDCNVIKSTKEIDYRRIEQI